MKKSSTFSVFRKNEYKLRFFVLSLTEGTFKYAADEAEAKKSSKSGVTFTYKDLFSVIGDHSNGGKTVDFSGEKSFPFPFTLMLSKRELTLATITREVRDMWVRAF
jgi:hypothetical protein